MLVARNHRHDILDVVPRDKIAGSEIVTPIEGIGYEFCSTIRMSTLLLSVVLFIPMIIQQCRHAEGRSGSR